jgi:hypothetical protein
MRSIIKPILIPRSLVLTCLLSLGAAVPVAAQTVPHKASGTSVYSSSSGDYEGPGVGTHVGKHHYSGTVAVTPTLDPFTFLFATTDPQVTVAADGSEIFYDLSGEVTLVPLNDDFTLFTAVWSGNAVIVGGTGRFADVQPADEPLQILAINDPFSLTDAEWSFSWTLKGQMRLR